MNFALTQIADTQYIVTPTNQPLPSLTELQTVLNTSDFTINTQTTSATTNRRQLGSDMKGTPHIISQTTTQQPVVTHIINLI